MELLTNEVTTNPATTRCEVITDFERLERLSTDWQRLTASDPRSEVSQLELGPGLVAGISRNFVVIVAGGL